MREIEVVLASLHYQVDQLLHSRIVTLQVKGYQLRYVKLQVLPHRCLQIRIDPALRQLSNSFRLARIKRNKDGNGVLRGLLQLLVTIKVGQPLGEALDEIWLACGELFLSAAATTAKQVVRDAT